MTDPYRIEWDTGAIDAAAGFLKQDPDGLRQLMDSIDQLAADPRPQESTAFNGQDVCRLFVGLYRVLYEIGPNVITIIVIHKVR